MRRTWARDVLHDLLSMLGDRNRVVMFAGEICRPLPPHGQNTRLDPHRARITFSIHL